ncbi:MAG TPA: biotin synthase BioB [Acidimicrobiales bacterium]|nr:biotin synthase BioB [Acidimicrobiales bacterium]
MPDEPLAAHSLSTPTLRAPGGGASAAPGASMTSGKATARHCPVALPEPPGAADARARIARAAVALLEEKRMLSEEELAYLAVVPDESVMGLASVAHEVRLAWRGPAVEVEGILSAKTGGCPEDCHFCAQSSRFDTPVKATPFLDTDEVLAAANETAALGASEFCIVLAVRGPDERTLSRILELVPLVSERTGLQVAVSAGILDPEQARRLAEAGVHRYNHNVETARSFFGEVVTTHTWEERAETCRLVHEHGMELCCGVLLGMGETDAQRVELLLQLRELDPAEVPLNFLNPRPGTPLGERPLVGAWEAIRWIALCRLALPGVILRYAGGREVTLRELQAMGMASGINALIVGNYLTTLGRSPEEDLAMLSDLAMPIGALSAAL